MGESMEAMLMEIHSELSGKLKAAHGKPLFITVSYRDEAIGKTKHWIGQNNDFGYEDMEKTLTHLTSQIEKNLKPKDDPIITDMRRQMRARKGRVIKRMRRR